MSRLLQSLSRETRDTFFLVGVVALTVAPHLPRLPLWAGAALALLLGWRAWLAWRGQPLPGRWLLAGLLIALVAAAKLSHGVLIGRSAGLTLVCLLLALKLLEMHDRRDAYVVFFLGFFLVLTQYLHSQALWVALWTLACVWGLMTALVLAQMPLGQPHLRLAAREAARTTALGLPAMLLLYLLFPRIAPLWGVPGGASTGLSDELSFGQVATLATDSRIALRLRPLPGSALPAAPDLYLRGPVLSDFDGQIWRASPPRLSHPPDALQPQAGPTLRYEMVVEPQRASVLPVLEFDTARPGETWNLDGLTLRRSAELSWISARPITQRLAFAHQASPARLGPLAEHPSLRGLRTLPPGLNPRLRDWVRPLAQGRSPEALVQVLLDHIRSQPFEYTLNPGVYGENSPHAIDEFWFEGRKGFCEHYAAALTVALRAAGVPARIVTGYQGRDAELLDGWAVVRNSNAHAWVEYWQAGEGWRRSDPTAAVAPERVRRGERLSPPPTVLQGAFDAIDPSLWLQLRRLGETLDLRWQQWVLGYSREQQFDLLAKLGFESPDWQALGQAVAGVIAALAGLSLAWMRWQQRDADPSLRLQRRTQQWLLRAGLPAQAHQSPLHWAELARARPGGEPLAAQLMELEQTRYGTGHPALGGGAWTRLAWLRRLRRNCMGLRH
ncbi:transglutaminase-like putative cysteine protease [Inhella inkyongensis]|uniref:Transglutaminase-like putative cysteine protease n=1 Tax=Inhella inkyongensis TaxID=392593 RepID=A0A840SBH4_9BURK|nr:DUF3488 and transglutaminase-like domain-containing protein [Inhella inkyongensis]MBB5206134.1 transglutaminase-like putative cysteine protease [Inhella inkyongensis]